MKFSPMILAGAAALCLAAPAQAALVDLTWTGTASGNDGLGLFGAAGALSGVAYTAAFRFDTDVSFFENATNGSESVSGGSFYARPSPWVSASITINGVTVAMGGGYASEYFRQTGQGQSLLAALAQREVPGGNAYGGELFQRVFRGGDGFYGGPDLTEPGEYDFTAADNPGGNFSFFNVDANGDLVGPITGLAITPDHLVVAEVRDTGAIPEPSTWALLIAGFGLAGAALRRRAAAVA